MFPNHLIQIKHNPKKNLIKIHRIKIIPNHFYGMTMMTSPPATQVGMVIPSNFFDENYSL